jgi:hypothetical protein
MLDINFRKHKITTSTITMELKQMENTVKNIIDYVNGLKDFDWFYSYSDDHSVWEKAEKSKNVLLTTQKILDPNFEIWNSIAPEQFHNGAY